MAAVKETKDAKELNIYQKLQLSRVKLQQTKLKKSGKNTYSNYDYFELGDFLPAINEIMAEYGLTAIYQFTEEKATLSIIDTDNPESQLMFSTPVSLAVLKGAHPIQNIGATQTYTRRYLYVMAFEIAEGDTLDNTQPDEKAVFDETRIDGGRAATIGEMLKKTSSDTDAFLAYFRAKKITDLKNKDFKPAMDLLERKQRAQEAAAKMAEAEQMNLL